MQGAIKKILDILLYGSTGTGQCHQMPQGGERGLAKVSRDIFSKI